MYHHEAMRQKDADQFKEAMTKKWNDQVINGNFTIIPRSQLPQDATILPANDEKKRHKVRKNKEIQSTSEHRRIKNDQRETLRTHVCTSR